MRGYTSNYLIKNEQKILYKIITLGYNYYDRKTLYYFIYKVFGFKNMIIFNVCQFSSCFLFKK